MIKKSVAIFIFVIIVIVAAGFLWSSWTKKPETTTAALQPQPAAQEQTVDQEQEINEVQDGQAALIAQESAELQQIVDDFSASYPSTVRVSVVDLSNGASASYNPDKRTVSASLYKMFVAYGIYQMIDNGSLSASQNISSLGLSVNQCLNLMITISDNPCGKALGGIAGWSELDKELAQQGYSNTTLDNYDGAGNIIDDKYTTTSDATLLLKRLYEGNLLGQDSSDNFVSLLKQQTYNDWLPAGLPGSATIAHKTGALYGYVHDAGIVYGSGHDYVIVVMSGEWNSPEATAPPVFAEISGNIWQYFSENF
ncbi:MAG: class A beta-lactamase-related serine hydrolase [Candidatus Woesebacteria bacterium]|jgi:beta-lactamase class A